MVRVFLWMALAALALPSAAGAQDTPGKRPARQEHDKAKAAKDKPPEAGKHKADETVPKANRRSPPAT